MMVQPVLKLDANTYFCPVYKTELRGADYVFTA